MEQDLKSLKEKKKHCSTKSTGCEDRVEQMRTKVLELRVCIVHSHVCAMIMWGFLSFHFFPVLYCIWQYG